MLERLCKELNVRFIGRWEDVGGYMFIVMNPRLACFNTSFVVFDTDRVSIINKINELEQIWVNTNLKARRNAETQS